jgi:heat shock protein HslJ
MMDASQVQTPVENPELYTAAFSEDGTVSIKADCNQASSYGFLGSSFAIVSITEDGPQVMPAEWWVSSRIM